MKSVEEMRAELEEYCTGKCNKCKNENNNFCSNYAISNAPEDIIVEWHKAFFTEQYVGHDSVSHPSHYNKGKIEVWDFISDQGLNFDRGNAIKYICRAGTKDPDKEIQDLKKAIEYINHEIKMLKGETNNGTEKET